MVPESYPERGALTQAARVFPHRFRLFYTDGDWPRDGYGAAMDARLRLAPDPAGRGSEPLRRSPIRVTLVDGHEPMRRSLRLLLDGEQGIEVIVEAADMGAVEVGPADPDVLVADLHRDGASPPQAISSILGQAPHLGIVALTMQDVPVLARQILEAGALGLVRKQFADRELAQAVRAAARGEVYVSPPIAAQLWPDR